MIGLSFMIICGVTCHIRGYDKDHKIRLSLREIGRTFFHALLPILDRSSSLAVFSPAL